MQAVQEIILSDNESGMNIEQLHVKFNLPSIKCMAKGALRVFKPYNCAVTNMQ